LPVAVFLIVPIAILGALIALLLRNSPNDVFFQVSLITLVGLAGCTAYDVVGILEKKRQKLTGLEVQVRAEQLSEVPYTFTKFHIHYIVKGHGLSEKAVEDAIQLSDEKYCSVANTLKLAAEVSHDYEIVAANLLDGGQRSVDDRIAAYALFIDPPLGRVGMSEAQVRATGRPALVGVMPMSRVGRAKERGETQGFMKVLVDAQTERILGASLLCIEGDEIVHSLLDMMAADASYRVVQRAVHIHPTVSELIPTLLGQLVPLRPLEP